MTIGKVVHGIWFKIGPLLVIIFAVALPGLIGELNQMVRIRWTYCFDDPAPRLAEARLATGLAALARNDEPTARRLVMEGQDIIGQAARQWPYKYIQWFDSGPMPPEYVSPIAYEINRLRRDIRAYRYECYPLRMLENPQDAMVDWMHRNDPQIDPPL